MNGLERAVTFYELKTGWTFEYKMAHLEDKIVIHASWEMHSTTVFFQLKSLKIAFGNLL